MYNDELNKILLSSNPDSINEQIEQFLTTNEIEFKQTSNMQYKILNGCVKNIMFYPSSHKIMIQEKGGKNYIQTADCKTLIAVIKGDVSYKKEETND